MKSVVAVKREALFIRKDALSPSLIKKLKQRYTHHFFSNKACADCENSNEQTTEDGLQVSDLCQNCAGYLSSYSLCKFEVINDNKYVKLPLGDLPRLRQFFTNNDIKLKVKSKAPRIEIRPIHFKGVPRSFQPAAVSALIEAMRGILKSAPRTGKTVMSAMLVCELGLKTLIVASQRDWLNGFHETFVGSDTQPPLTDLKKSRIGFCRTLEDFKKYDICLVTVQTFHSEKGQRLLRRIRDMFSVVIVDEVHTSAAEKYLAALARLNALYMIGLSGTPSRKDMKMVLANTVLGPVVHKTEVPRLRPTIRLVRTKYYKAVKGNVPWHNLVGPLERDKTRLRLLADTAIKDVARGHMILIPLSGVKAIQTLIELINKRAGKRLAYPFWGGVKKDDRKKYVEMARQYKAKILVGQMKLLSTGINIPRASMLYEVSISSNMENCEQRVSRILTPYDGKPPPEVKFFLDNMSVRKKCMANEWFGCVSKIFKPMITSTDLTILMEYFRSKQATAHDIGDML